MISSESALSEHHLVNEHLALILPCLYHYNKSVDDQQCANTSLSHSFPQSQIRVFCEGEHEIDTKTDTPSSQVAVALSILSQSENDLTRFITFF